MYLDTSNILTIYTNPPCLLSQVFAHGTFDPGTAIVDSTRGQRQHNSKDELIAKEKFLSSMSYPMAILELSSHDQ